MSVLRNVFAAGIGIFLYILASAYCFNILGRLITYVLNKIRNKMR